MSSFHVQINHVRIPIWFSTTENPLGKALREARLKHKGLTPSKLGKKLQTGYDAETIKQVENGKRFPDRMLLIRLIRLLRIDENEFMPLYQQEIIKRPPIDTSAIYEEFQHKQSPTDDQIEALLLVSIARGYLPLEKDL